MDSKWLPLATASILGQAPSQGQALEQLLDHTGTNQLQGCLSWCTIIYVQALLTQR
jgi:hypothetical protein